MLEFNFENLLKISFPLMIILALLKLTAYYYHFSIPILNYIELSEVITLFLNDIASYLFVLLIPFLLIPNLSRIEKKSIFFGAMLCAVIAAVNLSGDMVKAYLLLYLPLIGVILSLSPYFKNKWLLATLLYLCMLLSTSIIGSMKASGVKNEFHYTETEVQIDTMTIRTDSTFYYLGKTNNYIFFYDAKKEESIIYPCDKVVKVASRKSKLANNCLPALP